MKKLLFICTGNTCRSAMAEGICRAMAKERGDEVLAASCGLAAFAGDPASEYAVQAAAEYGADLKKHRSRPLNPYIVEEADAIYCMTGGHLARLLALYPDARDKASLLLEGQDIPDPWGGDLETYRAAAKVIAGAVEQRLKETEEQP